MRRARRGFTLVELTAVIGLVGITTAALGHLYLEARAAGVRTEAQIELERRAGLVLEHAARDLRGGALEGLAPLTFTTPDGPVRYQVQDGLLERIGPGGPRALARHAVALEAEAVPDGHRLTVTLDRALLPGRHVAVRRSVFVGARR